MAKYKNPWYSPHGLSPEYYTTDVKPEEYRGYLIYHREKQIWDIVKAGVCIGQNAGPNGAKRRIDGLIARKISLTYLSNMTNRRKK